MNNISANRRGKPDNEPKLKVTKIEEGSTAKGKPAKSAAQAKTNVNWELLEGITKAELRDWLKDLPSDEGMGADDPVRKLKPGPASSDSSGSVSGN